MLYNIFPLFLINQTIIGKTKFIDQKECFDFIYEFV